MTKMTWMRLGMPVTPPPLRSPAIPPQVDGDGVKVSGSTVTITAAGTYDLSGTLADGEVIVYAADDAVVRLVLKGADISSSGSAPLYVMSCAKTVLVLAEGSENSISDENSADTSDAGKDVSDAAIFSKCNLTINGAGSLAVSSAHNNGIKSNDWLKITGGKINVTAALDGIRGKDYFALKDGSITVDAGSDGVRSNNDEDAEKGFVIISGGTLNITAAEDGIQAETSVLVEDGAINIICGGGSANAESKVEAGGMDNMGGALLPAEPQTKVPVLVPVIPPPVILPGDSEDTVSMKGIKAAIDLTIKGGTINIDAADDALHSNGSLTIDSGKLNLDSGDDGIHADTSIVINDGTIAIGGSYEGIESAAITQNGGNVSIVSSDDGINVAGGNDASAFNNGQMGQDSFNSDSSYALEINGGYLYIDAIGDGLDSNGTIVMTGG